MKTQKAAARLLNNHFLDVDPKLIIQLYNEISLDSKLIEDRQEPECSFSLLAKVSGHIAAPWIDIHLPVQKTHTQHIHNQG